MPSGKFKRTKQHILNIIKSKEKNGTLKLTKKTKNKISLALKKGFSEGRINYWLGKKMPKYIIKKRNKTRRYNGNYKMSEKNKILFSLRLTKDWNLIGKVPLHRRIEKNLGKPRFCEHCKSTDKKVYDWSNKDHKYKEDLSNWQRLCRGCHLKYDYKKQLR